MSTSLWFLVFAIAAGLLGMQTRHHSVLTTRSTDQYEVNWWLKFSNGLLWGAGVLVFVALLCAIREWQQASLNPYL